MPHYIAGLTQKRTVRLKRHKPLSNSHFYNGLESGKYTDVVEVDAKTKKVADKMVGLEFASREKESDIAANPLSFLEGGVKNV